MINKIKIKQSVVLVSVAFVLFGCARGKEFAVIEREQVTQNSTYPEFTRPKAAVNQFTDEEKENLKKRLEADKKMAQAGAIGAHQNASAQGHNTVNDIRSETDEVLRQIEQSGTQQ